MHDQITRRVWALSCAVAVTCSYPSCAAATDLFGTQPFALDQPRINALLRRGAAEAPLTGTDVLGDEVFNIEAFYDTGASGVILSESTADVLGVNRARFPESAGTLVTFEDVGVAGSDTFNVSEPLHISLAPFHPLTDINNLSTQATVYDQSFGPIHTQVGPLNVVNPLLSDIDVFGMPTMRGKVVVMDPKPVDTLLDTMRTYVYEPDTPFDPGAKDIDPGIPVTNRTVRLSLASFNDFTTIQPAGAQGPMLAANPFIGHSPYPLDPAASDTPPGVTVSLNGHETTGSFLFDTGAAASLLSKKLAADLHLRYVQDTENTNDPRLETFDPLNPTAPGSVLVDQFEATIFGIGGSSTVAGFFLDSLLLRTVEGDTKSPDDPNHLRFVAAPVLVSDITLLNPTTQTPFTLDGVLGMNYLVASAFVSEDPFTIGPFGTGAFNWLVFDETRGELRLDLKAAAVPIPTAILMLLSALLSLLAGTRRRAAPG